MDNNTVTLLDAEKRQGMINMIRKSTPQQLLNMADTFNQQDDETLDELIQSGWLRLFFTEWQIQLKQFAHRFVLSNDNSQLIRIMRGREASGLHSELETFQLSHILDEGYFLNEKDGTLNIQCAFPKSAYRPYYQLPINGIRGYLIDFNGDFPVEADTARDVNDPTVSTSTPDAVSFARQQGALLQQAFAAVCLPQSLTVDTLRERLETIDDIGDQHYVWMNEAAAALPMAMWRIETTIWFGDDVQTYDFFTFAATDTSSVITLQDDLIRVSSFDGVAGVFNRGDVESYTVFDALTDKKIDSVVVSIDQDTRY